MKLRLKPYREYRDSGVPWLGVLPSHWDIRRLKHLFSERDVRTRTGEERLLSLRMRAGLIDHLEAGGKPIAASALVGYKCVKPPEIVMNRMRAASGLFAVASRPGLVSPDYAVFQPKAKVNPTYYVQLFKSPTMTRVFRMESKGLGTGEAGFMRLYTDRFGNISAPLPPTDEQLAIVSFLNHFEHLVLRYVRAKMKVIALLNEQKRTIIRRAVTHGVAPNMRLKPSGVDWLGDVPENWEVLPIKRVLKRLIDTEHKTAPAVEGGAFMVVRTTNIKGGKLIKNKAYYTNYAGFREWTRREVPRPGDILFTREAPAGEACIVPADTDLCMGQRVVLMRGNQQRVDPEFLLLSIQYGAIRDFIKLKSQGSTVPHFNMSDIAGMLVLIPPVYEQQTIVETSKSQTVGIDAAIQRAESEVELLREYRIRLVADVVTGKLDVRNIELPAINDAGVLEIIDNSAEIETDEPTGSEEATDGDN